MWWGRADTRGGSSKRHRVTGAKGRTCPQGADAQFREDGRAEEGGRDATALSFPQQSRSPRTKHAWRQEETPLHLLAPRPIHCSGAPSMHRTPLSGWALPATQMTKTRRGSAHWKHAGITLPTQPASPREVTPVLLGAVVTGQAPEPAVGAGRSLGLGRGLGSHSSSTSGFTGPLGVSPMVLPQ